MSTAHQASDIIQCVAERFAPFAAIGGPLSAGHITYKGQAGALYLSETRAWLFLAEDLGEELEFDGTLSHGQVSEALTPIAVIRGLLDSMHATIDAYKSHIDRIEARAEHPDAILGFYLSSLRECVLDAIALGDRSALKQ